jgi:hypothetical protein
MASQQSPVMIAADRERPPELHSQPLGRCPAPRIARAAPWYSRAARCSRRTAWLVVLSAPKTRPDARIDLVNAYRRWGRLHVRLGAWNRLVGSSDGRVSTRGGDRGLRQRSSSEARRPRAPTDECGSARRSSPPVGTRHAMGQVEPCWLDGFAGAIFPSSPTPLNSPRSPRPTPSRASHPPSPTATGSSASSARAEWPPSISPRT